MRVSGLLPVIAVVACLSPPTSTAQTAAQRRAAASVAAEEQTEPYHKHRDTRHGHDHYYPDRGAIVRDLPAGTIGTSYAGVSYRYHDGIWLEPRGPAYMVVSPPLGLIAPTLPLYSTVVAHGSESFLYCNDTYYRPRPDLGGYEVVNDPAMEAGAPPAAPEALVGGQMPSMAPNGGGAVTAGGGVGSGSAGMGPGVGTAAVVPVVAREGNFPREASLAREASVPREAGFSGGAMPGVGAAAASVPAPSLGAGASTSASAAPAAVGAPAGAGGVPVTLGTGAAGSGSTAMGPMRAGSGSAAAVGPGPAGSESTAGAMGPTSARSGSPVEAAGPTSARSGSPVEAAGLTSARSGSPAEAAGPTSARSGSPAEAAGSAPAGSGSSAAVSSAATAGSTPAGAAGTPKVPKVFLYPRNGQSADQQARDRYDCYRFAVGQSGFDPLRTGVNPPPGSEAPSDFERAQSACFEGRGYSNR